MRILLRTIICSIVIFGLLPSLSLADTIKFANDPTPLSVGARVLGMGGSFTGVADDTSAIFINPGGLGRIATIEISSMSGKFLNLFNYVQFSGLYPTHYGTLGLAYGGSSIDFRFPSSETIVIGDETRIVPTGEVAGKYANTAMLLSWGKTLDVGQIEDLSVGATLKLLSQDLSASGLSGGTASGLELNLGLLYPVREGLTLGIAVENALPYSMGGKVTWSTGNEESLPARFKTGIDYQYEKLTLALDYDRYVSLSNVPALWHAGVEWRPVEFAALRAGFDQNYSAGTTSDLTVSNDPTYGFGLFFRGFRFDYAYHTYYDLPDNTTHYFSLSYLFDKKKPVKTPEIKKVLEINLRSFRDVPAGYWAKLEIEQLATLGIISGYPDGTFRPEATITRAELATLLMRLRDQATVDQTVSFNDVSAQHWAAKYIGQAVAQGVVSGYPDGSYKPGKAINRAEGVAMIARFAQLAKSRFAEVPYQDVPGRYWAAQAILSAKEAGLLVYIRGEDFQPSRALTRAETAYILSRTKEINQRIKELMNQPVTSDIPAAF